VRTAAALDDETGLALAAPAPAAAAAPAVVDGEPMSVSEKELTSVELFPVSVQHNANGRFVAVVGDNEFVIYTAQALRNKTFGPALDFVWSASGTGDYAVRESTSKVKVFKNFKEVLSFRPGVAAEGLSGGALLGVRSTETLVFYDWDSDRVVRKIEVAAKGVFWNDSGELVAIAAEDSFFVLRCNRDAYLAALAAAAPGSPEAAVFADEGVEAAFELQHTIDEKVRHGVWVGDCFLYTNAASRLNYYVGGEVITLAHLGRHMYMLGYLPREGRVYLMDKTGAIVSYALLLALLEYQTAVVRRDFAAANRILAEIPREHYNKIAKFLDGQGFKAEAIAVADDPDLKFDLAVQLGRLDMALQLLRDAAAAAADAGGAADDGDAQAKWRTLLDLALARSNLGLAEECALAARDVSSLLLLYSSTGDAAGMARLAALARDEGHANVAFLALHALGRVEDAAKLLADTGRNAEVSAREGARRAAGRRRYPFLQSGRRPPP
jgi:coatomer subunit beta'